MTKTMTTIERTLDGCTFRGQVCAELDPVHGEVFAPDALLIFDQKVAQLAANRGAHGPQTFRFLRKVAQLGLVETARLLGVDRATVYRWEKGTSDITSGMMETMRALALDATRNEHGTLDRLNAALEAPPRTVEVPALDEAC